MTGYAATFNGEYMLDNVLHTALLVLVTALFLRKVSPDDVPVYWQVIVVVPGAIALAVAFVAALMKIWQ